MLCSAKRESGFTNLFILMTTRTPKTQQISTHSHTVPMWNTVGFKYEATVLTNYPVKEVKRE